MQRKKENRAVWKFVFEADGNRFSFVAISSLCLLKVRVIMSILWEIQYL